MVELVLFFVELAVRELVELLELRQLFQLQLQLELVELVQLELQRRRWRLRWRWRKLELVARPEVDAQSYRPRAGSQVCASIYSGG